MQAILQARSDLSVIITGHSMGGAMATFCALDLSVSLLTVMEEAIVRFGGHLTAMSLRIIEILFCETVLRISQCVN